MLVRWRSLWYAVQSQVSTITNQRYTWAKYKLNSQSDATANLETLESVMEIIKIKTTVVLMQQPLLGGAHRDIGTILQGLMASSNKDTQITAT